MTQLVIVLAALAMISGAAPGVAQTSIRLEAGFGAGLISEGGGVNGRIGIGVVAGKWGAVVRLAGHSGAEGIPEPGLAAFFSGLFGPPRESFDEVSILVTRSLTPSTPHRLLLSAGLGTISGRRIDPADGVGLVDVEKTWGVPLELALHGGDGRGIGLSLVLSAHINSEVPQFGLGAVVTLGWLAGGAG